MNPTHIGTNGTGGRFHLTDAHGATACGRAVAYTDPLEEIVADYADRLCASCVSRLADDACRRLLHEPSASVRAWEAQAYVEIGAFMLRYLDEHPAPAPSERANDFATWGRKLRRLGQERGGR